MASRFRLRRRGRRSTIHHHGHNISRANRCHHHQDSKATTHLSPRRTASHASHRITLRLSTDRHHQGVLHQRRGHQGVPSPRREKARRAWHSGRNNNTMYDSTLAAGRQDSDCPTHQVDTPRRRTRRTRKHNSTNNNTTTPCSGHGISNSLHLRRQDTTYHR